MNDRLPTTTRVNAILGIYESTSRLSDLLLAARLALVAVLVLACGEAAAQGVSGTTSWINLGEDLQILELHSPTSPLGAGLLVRSSLRRMRIGVIRASEYGRDRLSVEELCRRSGAAVCINANFFDEFGKPLGIVISRGITHNALHRGGPLLTGIFEAGRNRLRIASRLDYDSSAALEAVQAGPRLVLNGAAVRGIKDQSKSNRSAVCIDSAGRVVFFVFSSNFGGISLQGAQEILKQPAVGCVDALNLDGGRSAQLFIDPLISSATNLGTKTSKQLSVRGYDEIPVALGLFERLPAGGIQH